MKTSNEVKEVIKIKDTLGEIGEILVALRDGSFEKTYEPLFELVASLGNRQLSLAVLRLIIMMECQETDPENDKKLQQGFIEINRRFINEMIPFSDIKAMEYCWGLAESLVEILNTYTKYNNTPDFSEWKDAIPHKIFSEFVNDLFMATKGQLSWTFFPDEIINYINDGYENLDYDTLFLWLRYLGWLMDWVKEKCPKFVISSDRYLHSWAAKLLKYSYVSLPGEPGIDVINCYKIVLLNPQEALPNLCRAYKDGVPNEDIFNLDAFHDTVFEVSQ